MADFFSVAPEPDSPLGRYRLLCPTAGVKVSPLCLGSMTFGDVDKAAMGECSKETVFEILDYFRSKGGNFIDTASIYQNQQSEQWIGEWMASRKCRDEIILATKFAGYYREGQRQKGEITSNYLGNSVKTMQMSLKRSLENLQTDYIDLLYVHWWDYSTSVEEVMQGLNREVNAGRVLYLGISDTPAWIVARANQYARDHGLRPFSVYQGLWNCAERGIEREIIPACLADDMAICPWRALGGGAFKSAEQRASGEGRQIMGATPNEEAILDTLEKVAAGRGTKAMSIALAFVLASAPNVYPIIGTRKVEHLKDAIDALNIRLTAEEMEELRAANAFDPGFPVNAFGGGASSLDISTKTHVGVRRYIHVDLPSRRAPAFAPSAR